MTQAKQQHGRPPLAAGAREAMEALNAEAAPLHIWLRTQANAPAQRPWFKETALEASGALAQCQPTVAAVPSIPSGRGGVTPLRRR